MDFSSWELKKLWNTDDNTRQSMKRLGVSFVLLIFLNLFLFLLYF